MQSTTFRPVIYTKENCPFCLKVRLFALESGQLDSLEIREFSPGSDEEETIRAELGPHLDKVSFPAAQLMPGEYVADSDAIVANLSERSGRNASDLPVYRSYADGVLVTMVKLYQDQMARNRQ